MGTINSISIYSFTCRHNMEGHHYLVTVEMDSEVQKLVEATRAAAQNSKRDEVIPKHTPTRPLRLYKLPHGQEANALFKCVLKNNGTEISNQLKERHLSLGQVREPMLYELDEGWYTKKRDEIAIVILLARTTRRFMLIHLGGQY